MGEREKSLSTTEAAWREWKKKCAAGLCSEEHAAMLRRFGAARFTTYAKRYASTIGHHHGDLRLAEAADGWHLLETHACTARNRAGKRYKDWLFARATGDDGDALAAAMEAGATLLMRDVARNQLRAEHAPAFMASLQRPAGSGHEPGYTLEDLLPDHVDPADDAAELEWQAIAHRYAEEQFCALDERQRLVIWARARGVSFSDADLLRMAGCKEAVLHKTYQRLMHQLGRRIKMVYAGESTSALVRLACMVHAEIADRVHQKYFVQSNPPRSFIVS